MEKQAIKQFRSAFGIEFREIRDAENRPWYIGSEVAKFLEYKNSRVTIRDHVDFINKTKAKEFCLNNHMVLPELHPHTNLINESGLYTLIIRSKLPTGRSLAQHVPTAREHLITIEDMRQKMDSLINKTKSLLATLEETENEKALLASEMEKMQKAHDTKLAKRSYHKFKKGPCFYIVKDDWREVDYFKIGVTGDINERLRHYRTSMPHTRLMYLLYLNENYELESTLKLIFKKHLSDINREYITGVPLDKIIKETVSFVDLCSFDFTLETGLDKYNDFM